MLTWITIKSRKIGTARADSNISASSNEEHRREQQFGNKLFVTLLIVASIALVTSLYLSVSYVVDYF